MSPRQAFKLPSSINFRNVAICLALALQVLTFLKNDGVAFLEIPGVSSDSPAASSGEARAAHANSDTGDGTTLAATQVLFADGSERRQAGCEGCGAVAGGPGGGRLGNALPTGSGGHGGGSGTGSPTPTGSPSPAPGSPQSGGDEKVPAPAPGEEGKSEDPPGDKPGGGTNGHEEPGGGKPPEEPPVGSEGPEDEKPELGEPGDPAEQPPAEPESPPREPEVPGVPFGPCGSRSTS